MSQDSLFSQRIYDLRQQLLDAKDSQERETLMLQIAQEALDTHDPTDTIFVDDYHAYFDEFEVATANYKQAARRVARLICDGIDSMDQAEESKPAPRRRTNLN